MSGEQLIYNLLCFDIKAGGRRRRRTKGKADGDGLYRSAFFSPVVGIISHLKKLSFIFELAWCSFVAFVRGLHLELMWRFVSELAWPWIKYEDSLRFIIETAEGPFSKQDMKGKLNIVWNGRQESGILSALLQVGDLNAASNILEQCKITTLFH